MTLHTCKIVLLRMPMQIAYHACDKRTECYVSSPQCVSICMQPTTLLFQKQTGICGVSLPQIFGANITPINTCHGKLPPTTVVEHVFCQVNQNDERKAEGKECTYYIQDDEKRDIIL